MIRLSSLVWLVLIASAGTGLYLLKYRVIELENALATVERNINANREAVARLHAEWSYLNDPDAIAAYASHYLDTRPATARDIVAMWDIPLARSRATPAGPARDTPGGSMPPPPPVPPLRGPAPGEEPHGSSGALLAAGDSMPATELSLVPAARSPQSADTRGTPTDPIGRLIADVLQQRADATPLASGGPAQGTLTRGLGQ